MTPVTRLTPAPRFGLRRRVLLCLGGAALVTHFKPARAQGAWPDRPVRMIVPTAAGSGSDLLARALAQKLAEAWRQPVTVDNRAGGTGVIGVEAVVRAAPDAYTLLFSSASPVVINPLIFKKLPHDPQTGLAPVSHVGIGAAALLVNASNPAQTLRDFVAQAKAAPGKLSYGSFGAGSGGHLALEALCQAAGISMIHVPYKGTGPAITDLLGGQITSVLTDLATAAGHIKAGRLRALAINGPVRSGLLPEVPTFTEQGFAAVEATYARFGVFATAGTPAPLIERIATDITAALRQPDLRDKFAGIGYSLEGSTPAAFAATLRQDAERWGQVIAKLGGLTLD